MIFSKGGIIFFKRSHIYHQKWKQLRRDFTHYASLLIFRNCFFECLKFETFLRDDKVDDHGGPAGQGGLCADVEVVDGLGAHERHLAVGVGVDPTRDDELSAGIDHSNSTGNLNILANFLNHPGKRETMA